MLAPSVALPLPSLPLTRGWINGFVWGTWGVLAGYEEGIRGYKGGMRGVRGGYEEGMRGV